MSEEQNSSAGM
jgi:U4/U6 small nuclear ribonucleoprotein SNU13